LSDFENRLNKLRDIFDDKNTALLITNEKNIYYFTGFQKSEGALLVTYDEVYLLVDFRYYEAACNIAKACKVQQFSNLTASIIELMNKHNANTLNIEAKSFTLDRYNHFLRAFNEKGISINSNGLLDKKIENLRLRKSQNELSFISEAQKITEKAYKEVLNYVKVGETERNVAIELEYLMKKYGAEDISFDLITITGKKTSLPHGVPSDDVICSGDFFTMDIGAIYNGYHSDMTRTVAVEFCNDKQKEIYNTVLSAQLAGLDAVKSGVKASFVDKTCRDVIKNAGYGENFGHSTGHGVGLDIHEMPFVSPKGETLLTSGMVITVEPGIYIENEFGVRIEDMISVTDNGYKNFATLSKELIIV
jgi:Xaa-Pro aminopeptidase